MINASQVIIMHYKLFKELYALWLDSPSSYSPHKARVQNHICTCEFFRIVQDEQSNMVP